MYRGRVWLQTIYVRIEARARIEAGDAEANSLIETGSRIVARSQIVAGSRTATEFDARPLDRHICVPWQL